MSFAKHDLAPKGWELGRLVLALSALGIFTKLLKIDLNQVQILGVSFGSANTALIPGFIGLALMYSFAAFVLSRLESAFHQQTNKEAQETYHAILENKVLTAIAMLAAPLSFFVYSLPYLLGLFSIVFLWSDSITVIRSVWQIIRQ